MGEMIEWDLRTPINMVKIVRLIFLWITNQGMEPKWFTLDFGQNNNIEQVYFSPSKKVL